MTLQAFCFAALGIGLAVVFMGAVIEWLNERRESDGKRIRDLVAENARLRAEVRRAKFNGEWELDAARTELAVKELLLRQKWAEAKNK